MASGRTTSGVFLLLCAALATHVQAPAQPPLISDPNERRFNNLKTPLGDEKLLLLAENGYRIQPDGTIKAPGGAKALGQSEVRGAVEQMQGKKRLKALLEINIIFNKHGTKNLPQDALTEVRLIARKNWDFLPDRTRADLKPFFTLEELESMIQGVRIIRAPATWVSLDGGDLPPEIAYKLSASAPPAARKPAADAPGGVGEAALPAVQRLRELEAAEAAARAAIVAASTGNVVQGESGAKFGVTQAQPQRMAAASLSTAPAPVPAAPDQQAAVDLSTTAAIASLPEAWRHALQNPSVAQTPPPAAEPALSQYPEVAGAEFEKFLSDAPYGHEVHALLRKLSEHAPADVRRTALGVVMRHLPLIMIDSAKAGTRLHAATRRIHEDPDKPSGQLILLSPGPVLTGRPRLFFGSREFLLPDAPEFYEERGARAPRTQAATPGSIMERDIETDRGKMREYPDGSRRLRFTPEQMAGTLLAELVRIDARSRAGGADAYRAEILARSAQFRFYKRLRRNTGAEPLLDRGLQAEYAEWLQRPQDWQNFLVQSLAAPAAAELLPSLSGRPEDRSAWSRKSDAAALDEAGVDVSAHGRKVLEARPTDAAESPSAELDASLAAELKTQEAPSAAGAAWNVQESGFRSEIESEKR